MPATIRLNWLCYSNASASTSYDYHRSALDELELTDDLTRIEQRAVWFEPKKRHIKPPVPTLKRYQRTIQTRRFPIGRKK